MARGLRGDDTGQGKTLRHGESQQLGSLCQPPSPAAQKPGMAASGRDASGSAEPSTVNSMHAVNCRLRADCS
jgi:hypothetical protein